MKRKKKGSTNKIKAPKYHPQVSVQEVDDKEMNIAHNNIQLQYYTFNNKQHRIEYPYTADDCRPLQPIENGIAWLNLNGVIPSAVRKLGEIYNIDDLLIDDALSVGQRAKLDDYGADAKFLLMPMLHLDTIQQSIEVQQISIIIKDNIVITIQEQQYQDPFNKIRVAIKQENALIHKYVNTDFLLHQILDAVVDEYFAVLEYINAQLDSIDELINNNEAANDILPELSAIRKNILLIRKILLPVKDVVYYLYTSPDFIAKEQKKYYKDLLDHITIAIEHTDTYKELANNLRDGYMSILNAKTNEVMKILTVVTTILAPFTILSSIYGMNFEGMPLLNNVYGFYMILGLSVCTTILMLIYFKSKKWF